MVKTELTIEGPNVALRTYSVDTAKPKCWVEGSTYHFNSALTKTITMQKKDVARLMEQRTFVKREQELKYGKQAIYRENPA